MTGEERIAVYQADLLRLLEEGAGPEELAERLRLHGWEFHDTLDHLEPECVETAVELVRKWGVRSPPEDPE